MDDFYNALLSLGVDPQGSPAASPASSVPPGLLKAVIATESGGNSNAVSPKGARGVMQVMPATNSDPGFGVSPARDGSEAERTRVGQDYLGALHDRYKDPALTAIAYNMGPGATDKWLQNGGDFNKLPAETQGYVGKVMTHAAVNGRVAQAVPAAAAPAQSAPEASDDFSNALAQLSATEPAKTSASNIPRIEIRGTSADEPALNANGVRPMFSPGTGSAGKNAAGAGAPISSPEFDLTANTLSSLGSTAVGGLGGIYSFGKTLLKGGGVDNAVNAGVDTIRGIQQAGTYQPRTAEGPKMIEQFGSNANPLAWIPNASQAIGDKAGTALEDIGHPVLGALAKGAGAAAPLALGFAAKPLSGLLKGGANVAEVPHVEPTMSPTAAVKPAYKLVDGKPVLISEGAPPQTVQQSITPTGEGPQAVPLSQVGKQPQAATAVPVPGTPEAVQSMAQSAPAKLFPETQTVAPNGGKFSPAEQMQRAKILESVGVDPNNMRKSALNGDGIGGSTDFQTAKIDSPAGRKMRSVLDQEKSALSDHADSLVKETGGTSGVDQSALYARGNTIVSPLDGMKKWFDNKTSQLYAAADAKAQGVPTQLSTFKDTLGDSSELTNSDRVHLQSAVGSYAKKLNMTGEDGSIAGSAMQAETIRKYLNEQWSPQNSKFVGKLKDALDEDVTKAAGEEIYSQARAVRSLRARTLDDPNGIAKIMDSAGPEGINRSVPVEKIADQVTGMPVEQFGHIVQTLKNAPPELQGQSAASISEIKAQFANKLQSIGTAQQGQWNAKGVTKYLQNNAGRMAQVFTPEEIGKFRNLNDAGHIVAKDQSYPGASVQGHNLMTSGAMLGLQGAGVGIGTWAAGPLGAAAGGYLGRAAANSIGSASELRNVNNRMVRLSDMAGSKP